MSGSGSWYDFCNYCGVSVLQLPEVEALQVHEWRKIIAVFNSCVMLKNSTSIYQS
jgi:hypothetical protein